MAGARVLVPGRTGRNFAAGMSGGIAWVYDGEGTFASRCNTELVGLEPLADPVEATEVRTLLERHRELTGRERAAALLEGWPAAVRGFVGAMPDDYRRVPATQAQMRAAGLSHEEAEMATFEEN